MKRKQFVKCTVSLLLTALLSAETVVMPLAEYAEVIPTDLQVQEDDAFSGDLSDADAFSENMMNLHPHAVCSTS